MFTSHPVVSRLGRCLLAGVLSALAVAQTPISGPLSGTLAAGVYIAGSISVPPGQTLTCAPGVIVKFAGAQQFVVSGTLICNGTVGNPVIFTDDADDSAGGDTNNNGPSVGVPGAWYDIVFASTAAASVLNHTEVRFAGTAGYSAIDLQGADIVLQDCTVRDCAARAFDLSGNSYPTITGCSVVNNAGNAIDFVPIHAVPGLTNNTASGNALDALRITTGAITSNLTLGLSSMLDGAFLVTTSVSVAQGVTLTLPAGAIVKWVGNQQLVVAGTLDCQGTAQDPVIFTDDADDSAGGDTNKDGASTGTPGAWYDAVFTATASASTLAFTEVRFAGTAGYSAIDLQGADVALQNCTVRDCAARGFDLSGNSYPTITGCSVLNNAGNAIDFVPIHAVPGLTGNTANGNAIDALRITTGTISSNLTLGLASMLDGAFLVTTSVSVAQGVTLTLPAGAIVKWVGNQQLVVAGTLDCQGTAQDPVIFTDDTDDSAGGDTNRDGASTGTPGAWYDAVFTSTAAASTLAFTEVRFAGTAGYSAIDLQGADVALQNCTVRDCAARGIDLSANSHPTITDCTVVDNAGNAIDHVRLDALPGLCNNTCSGNRIDCVRITSATVDVPLTIGTESMPAGALVLATGLNVTVTGDLTVQQGVVFKIEGAQQLVFTGPTRLLGTAYEPIVFTDDADDSIAGDTDKNGPSTGVRGAWYDLVFPPAAAARTVENVVVRFAGTAGYDAVDVRDSNVRLRAVRVDHAGARGFRLQNVGPAPVNLVAWDCGSDGIWLQGGSFDLWHATVAGNGGDGIEALAAWNGTIVNTNSHGNAGANYAGLTAARVVRSNGGFAGTNGNLDLDPLFVDLPNGDLHLAAGSPCLGAADPTFATMTAKDFDENPRLLDHALSGLAAADIGAFERGNWRMEVVNTPRPGETVFLTMQGPAGSSFLGFGLNDGSALVPPYGVLLCGSLTTTALVFTFPIPIGQTIPLTVPNDPGLAGTIIGLQTLNFPLGNLAVGNFGPLYRPLVRP